MKPLTKVQLGQAYEQVIGYDITKDAPQMTEQEIIKLMKEYDDECSDVRPFQNLNIY